MEFPDQEFKRLMGEAIDAIPEPYDKKLKNVAFILEDEPTAEQRLKMNLHPGQTLLGLYEGIPLPVRGGRETSLPDKITLFKRPLLGASRNLEELRQNIGHTIWHEVAHYYGLDHRRIDELDKKRLQRPD